MARFEMPSSRVVSRTNAKGTTPMLDVDSDVAQIDYRIAAIRANLRALIERAAASCGAADEERISQRIADQQELLEALTKQREELSRTNS
jgi:hypothetical protein